MNVLLPSDTQLDALREVANIGCGHAANALARLVRGQVDLSVPRVLVSSATEVALRLGGHAPVAAVHLGMTGELQGAQMMVLTPRDGAVLESVLLGGQPASPLERDSALEEAANIAASACLSAIGRLTRWRLLPTVPTLRRGPGQDVLRDAMGDAVHGGARRVVVTETHFTVACASPPVSGQMLLILERESAGVLLARLGL
ncbi:chemotaxis protein CheC [Myxococcaceae bacterium JPH2]|nr:chemotaxis protein CheC [Myxococcaceae bacterium JPH2]